MSRAKHGKAADVPPFVLAWPELVNVGAVQSGTATLVDGRVVDASGEEWRAECEARHVLNMPTKTRRLEYLARVGKRRGEAAREALASLVLAVWEWRRYRQADGDGTA